MKTKALFVDLDGTLIKTKSGREFPIDNMDWKFIKETVKAIKDYYKKGYKIIIATNQGGIELGYLTGKEFRSKMEYICNQLVNECELVTLDLAYVYAPVMEGYNRKPNPGMAYEAALEYELDLKQCIMIGDTDSDKFFAINASMKDYYGIEDIMFLYK
jgi:D-glycero-D-manno-heptose 1,7-bisphosphate phosphatase